MSGIQTLRIALFGKIPPIQGGVSTAAWEFCEAATDAGHTVCVITNATEAEPGIKCALSSTDQMRLKKANPGLQIISTTPITKGDFVPYSNPYLSKLMGAGCNAFEKNKFDLVVGWYLEPYCVAASALAELYGLPLYIRTAGSDLGRLAQHPDLHGLYRAVLRRAHVIFSGPPGSGTHRKLIDLGVESGRIINLRENGLPTVYSRKCRPLSLDWKEIIELEKNSGSDDNADVWQDYLDLNDFDCYDNRLPTIGIFGKVGRSKGTSNLLRALDELCFAGTFNGNVLCVPCGKREDLAVFFESARHYRSRNKNLLVVPPLAPWRIPEFLARCDIACVLEDGFPVETHSPRLPREILAAGVCLLMSREVARKQRFSTNLIQFKNCALVENPNDTRELCDVLRTLLIDLVATKDIAQHGRFLSRCIERFLEPGNSMINALVDLESERVLEKV